MAASPFLLLHILLLLGLVSTAVVSQSILQISSGTHVEEDDAVYCDSWRLSVETNNAGEWSTIPSRCIEWVQKYMMGNHYASDSEVVAEDSLAFAKTVEIVGDGMDAWVFDVDETLLSNLPYYALHGFGSEPFDEVSFDEWVALAAAPALPASLKLFKELQKLGFTVFVLTGRSEFQRNATVKNLHVEGYTEWKKLFLRGDSDIGKPAELYKSQKRDELVKEGYRIHGNSGDQWSDLVGFAVANRSFKLPNPMYYIP